MGKKEKEKQVFIKVSLNLSKDDIDKIKALDPNKLGNFTNGFREIMRILRRMEEEGQIKAV